MIKFERKSAVEFNPTDYPFLTSRGSAGTLEPSAIRFAAPSLQILSPAFADSS